MLASRDQPRPGQRAAKVHQGPRLIRAGRGIKLIHWRGGPRLDKLEAARGMTLGLVGVEMIN